MYCKTCKKKFHYCGSCDYDNVSDYGYCSEKCLIEGESDNLKELSRFYGSLNEYQKLIIDTYFECEHEIIFNYVRSKNERDN